VFAVDAPGRIDVAHVLGDMLGPPVTGGSLGMESPVLRHLHADESSEAALPGEAGATLNARLRVRWERALLSVRPVPASERVRRAAVPNDRAVVRVPRGTVVSVPSGISARRRSAYTRWRRA